VLVTLEALMQPGPRRRLRTPVDGGFLESLGQMAGGICRAPDDSLMVALFAACPLCPAALDARAMFLELDLLGNLLIALLPFAVSLAAVLATVRRSPTSRGSSDDPHR
jgi:hypothetical protein